MGNKNSICFGQLLNLSDSYYRLGHYTKFYLITLISRYYNYKYYSILTRELMKIINEKLEFIIIRMENEESRRWGTFGLSDF